MPTSKGFDWMYVLVAKSASFVVSYAESDEGNFLSKGFDTRHVTVRRHIAGSFTNRVKSHELLISHKVSETAIRGLNA